MISSIEKLEQNIISFGGNKIHADGLPFLLEEEKPKDADKIEIKVVDEVTSPSRKSESAVQDTPLKKPSKFKKIESEAERRARWQQRKVKQNRRRKGRVALREAEAAEEQGRNLQRLKALNEEHPKVPRPPVYFAALQKALKEKKIRREQRLQKSRNADKIKNLPVDIWAALREVSRRSVPNGVHGQRSMSQPVRKSPKPSEVSVIKPGQSHWAALREKARKCVAHGVCSQMSPSQLSKSQPVPSSHDSGEFGMMRQSIWEVLREKARRHFPNDVSQISKRLSPDTQLPHQRIHRKSSADITVGLTETIDQSTVRSQQLLSSPGEPLLKRRNCSPDITELAKLATRLGFEPSALQESSSTVDSNRESSLVNSNIPKDKSQVTEYLSQRERSHSRTEDVPAESVPPAVDTSIPFDSTCTVADLTECSTSVHEKSEEHILNVEELEEVSTCVLNPFRRQRFPPRSKNYKIPDRLSSSLNTESSLAEAEIVQVTPRIQKSKRRFQESSLPVSLSDKSFAIAIKRRKIQEERESEVIDLSN